ARAVFGGDRRRAVRGALARAGGAVGGGRGAGQRRPRFGAPAPGSCARRRGHARSRRAAARRMVRRRCRHDLAARSALALLAAAAAAAKVAADERRRALLRELADGAYPAGDALAELYAGDAERRRDLVEVRRQQARLKRGHGPTLANLLAAARADGDETYAAA